MSDNSILVAFTLFSTGMATQAAGDFQYLTSERSIEITVGLNTGSQDVEYIDTFGTPYVEANGFDDFDESITYSEVAYVNTGTQVVPYASAGGRGSQTSMLRPDSIIASASATNLSGSPAGSSSGSVINIMAVSFELTESTFVELDLLLDNDGGFYQLEGSGYFWQYLGNANATEHVNFTEELAPGTYELFLSPSGDTGGSYDFSLDIIPSPSGAALFGFAGAFGFRRRR